MKRSRELRKASTLLSGDRRSSLMDSSCRNRLSSRKKRNRNGSCLGVRMDTLKGNPLMPKLVDYRSSFHIRRYQDQFDLHVVCGHGGLQTSDSMMPLRQQLQKCRASTIRALSSEVFTSTNHKRKAS
mmetsp:Transcript_70347/g.111214  ORF Transcript_70347/g.111214 Transcript_70347/m.111214 type:complete len:127 (-) Transcript_70347:22-402(-)